VHTHAFKGPFLPRSFQGPFLPHSLQGPFLPHSVKGPLLPGAWPLPPPASMPDIRNSMPAVSVRGHNKQHTPTTLCPSPPPPQLSLNLESRCTSTPAAAGAVLQASQRWTRSQSHGTPQACQCQKWSRKQGQGVPLVYLLHCTRKQRQGVPLVCQAGYRGAKALAGLRGVLPFLKQTL